MRLPAAWTCYSQETIMDVIQRSEAAYASLFRTKPPLTIDAIKNDAGCFLPASLAVGQILHNGAHVSVVVNASSPQTGATVPLDCTIPRLFATWKQWQLYFAQALCAIAQRNDELSKETITRFEVVSHLSSLCSSTNGQSTPAAFASICITQRFVVLHLTLDCVERWLLVIAVDESTILFAQLLVTKHVLASAPLLARVLQLVDVFARSSREAQLSLIAHDMNTRLIDISATCPHVTSIVEPIVATLHALSMRQRRAPASSSSMTTTFPPPMAIQELLYCMHGKQRHSQDVATQQLVHLSESQEKWQGAVKGADAAFFAELLHVTTMAYAPGDTLSEALVTRVLQAMTNVISFQPQTLVVQDPNAIDALVTIGHQSTFAAPLRQQAAIILQHVVERQGHLGYSNVAGLVGLLQSTDPLAQAVGAAALLAALDGKAKVNPSNTHEAVLYEMCSCHVPALVDALYASAVPTRVAVLQVLNVLLQEEDVRQLVVVDLGCIPAFVSIFLDMKDVEGQRQAVKALSKIALSSRDRHHEVASAMEYVVSRSAFTDSVVAFYLDLIVPPTAIHAS
ncbi:hypothetical protein, variant 1 [Aphanomyces invadans]|uniref:Uncharacterized protein n=1 Tax=Aphanomyces invadans TaxID=157072 RepID=A0A024UV89_9STRA|nr:hypothetical protein, variant 1 [Aphanomyces invadans]ETW09870.1 hypothetical protein, variant 1 [Aphanomyces invadans]|eukprot:XP_008861283.1 hypothetical protein, variant 1 [Aphanomyces invadans]